MPVAATSAQSLGELSAESLESLLVVVAEVCVLGRPMLQVLLDERNEVIAANIIEECRRIRREGDSGSSSGETDCVVVVLGMAHCNGVKKLLVQR